MVRVIRIEDCPSRAWKNGGGRTRDVLVRPASATLEDFDWRISLAQVERDGPFSRFDNVDRTLVLLAGAMTLRDGEREIRLAPGAEPFSFAGERALTAMLDGDSSLDLNVMTRRERAQHKVHRHIVNGVGELTAAEGHTLLLFAIEPGLSIDGERLNAYDTAVVGPARATVHASRPTAALLVDIVELPAATNPFDDACA